MSNSINTLGNNLSGMKVPTIWAKDDKEAQNEEQQKTTFLRWNSKPSADYKLKHYLYCNNRAEVTIQVNSYNRTNLTNAPNLHYYQRYSPSLYLEQIAKARNQYYNSLMGDPMKSEVIQRPYNGIYAKQMDYQNFIR